MQLQVISALRWWKIKRHVWWGKRQKCVDVPFLSRIQLYLSLVRIVFTPQKRAWEKSLTSSSPKTLVHVSLLSTLPTAQQHYHIIVTENFVLSLSSCLSESWLSLSLSVCAVLNTEEKWWSTWRRRRRLWRVWW